MWKITFLRLSAVIFFSLTVDAAQSSKPPTVPPSENEEIQKIITPYLSQYTDDQVFAMVNDKPVVFSDIKLMYKRMLENFIQVYPDKPLTAEKARDLCSEALSRHTKKKALMDEIDKRKLNPEEAELTEQFQKVKIQYGVYFSQFLDAFKIKESDYKNEVRFRMGAAKLMLEYDKTAVVPEEKAAEVWYNDNKQKFMIPRKIKFSIICINNPDNADNETIEKNKKRLEELRAEILEGKRTFEEVAKNFSDEINSRKNGGSVGPVYVKDIKKDYASLVNLKLNELSPVTVYSQGFYIAKVTDDIPDTLLEFDVVKDKIYQGLKSQALQKHRQECLNNMLKEARVEIKESGLLEQKKEQK